MPTRFEEQLLSKIESIQCQIRDSLDNYFFDKEKNFLNDSLRPAYINYYEKDEKGKYCPIIIGLRLQIESLDTIYYDSIIEAVKGFWKSYNSKLTETSSSNIEINYVKLFEKEYFLNRVGEFFSLVVRDERQKIIYTGIVLLKLLQNAENLQITPILSLYQWKLVKENRLYISDSLIFNLENEAISLKEKREEKPLPTIADSILAAKFYSIIDKFLISKNQVNNINFYQNIIASLTDSINKHIQSPSNTSQYFRPTIYHLLKQFFKNYLAQPNVVRFNREFNSFSHQTSDKKEGFKFNYYIKAGVTKVGKYKVKKEYKKMEEYENLPSELKKLFESKEINVEKLIGNNYHSLCIKNGTILNLAIVNDSSLTDLIYAIKMFDDYGMWYDIIEFFSRYATALTIQDDFTFSESWYERAVRVSSFSSLKQLSITRKDIARRIMNLWQYRYTWVNYYLRKNPITDNFDVKFYCWSSEKNNGFQQVITFQNLNQKSNFMAEFSMNQHWYNFSRDSEELTYVSVDIVDFYLNIFNIKAAKSSLSGKLKMYPDDYFGLMIYLKHLFKDDNRLLEIKNKYKDHSEISKFLTLNVPALSEIPNFIHKNFDKDYLSRDEKKELVNFFESEDYERLHLEYNVFHQAYIQILGSRTRPLVEPELLLLDKFFH